MISTMRNLTNHGSTVGAMLASPVVGRIKPCEVYALFESITPCEAVPKGSEKLILKNRKFSKIWV